MAGVWIALGTVVAVIFLAVLYGLTIRSMYGEKIRTGEVYLVSTPDLWKIRVCRYRRGRTLGEPVLFCHGAGANHHNFSLPENESLIDYLMEKGYDCWAVDLRGCRSSHPPQGKGRFEATLDDYLLHDIPAVIDHICRVTGYQTIHWIGHSMGGLLLYAYALEYGPRRIAGAVTLGAPTGFDGAHKAPPRFLVRLFARHPRLITALAHGYIPIGRALRLPFGVFPVNMRNLHPRITVEHLYVMLDNLIPDVFVTLAGWMRKRTCLMKAGTLDVKAGLPSLRVPLLILLAPRDPFLSVEYGWRFFEALPTADKKLVALSKENGCAEDYNHVEMPFSRGARHEVHAPIAAWLAAHPARRQSGEFRDADGRLVGAAAAALAPHERIGILSGSSFRHLVEHDAPASSMEDAPPAPEDISTADDDQQAAQTSESVAETPPDPATQSPPFQTR